MMSKQFTLFGQAYGIDALRLERPIGQIGRCRHDHQRQKQIITPGQLRNQEGAGQRRMHHAGHDPRHAVQRIILFRRKRTDIELVTEMREDETGDSAQE